MTRVTGIGGIFIKARDPDALRAWYKMHLGVPVEAWGGAAFKWVTPENPTGAGTTVWSISKDTSYHFAPSTSSFMVNDRVRDRHALLALLREEGCAVETKVDESEDPAGLREGREKDRPGDLMRMAGTRCRISPAATT